MNRREFLFGSVACAVMPCFGNVGKDEIAENAVYSHECMCNEVLKCSKDIIYFAEKYIKLPYGKHLALKDWQKKYLRHLTAGKDAVLDAYRQSGKTLMNSIYAVWKTNFTPYQKITFVAVNKHMSDGCFENIKAMYDSLPEWMRSREDKTSERYMRDKKYLANKKYAFVRYEYPDDKYANQKGKVLDERTNENGSKSYLLKINVRQKEKGRHIHYVALMPIYEEVWFSESDIAKFLEYNENGKEIRK